MMKKSLIFTLILNFLVSTSANAASFNITGAETSQQTLDTNGDTGTITETGSITIADEAIVIDSGVSNTTVTNNGSITITTGSREAIEEVDATSDSNIFINNGTITIQGGSTATIRARGSNSTTTNSGTIIIEGGSSTGIDVGGNTSIITNSGTITTQGVSSYGIRSSGNNSTMTNSGTVTMKGVSSYAIRSSGNNSTMTNSGTITMEGGSSRGIDSDGNNATITNSGIITMQGGSSDGIDSEGDNATVTNSGTITVQGEYSDGIESQGNGSIINNSGTIMVTEKNSRVINLDASGTSNSTFTNTGILRAGGLATEAISGGDGTQTVILGKGSQITGNIDLGAGTDSVTVTGNGISGRLVTNNVETLTIAPGVAGVVVEGDIHVIDPTGNAAMTVAANNLTKTVNDVVNDANSKEDRVWSTIFGSEFERGEDNAQNLAYNHDYKGAVVGYDYGDNSGFVIGVSNGEIKTDSQSFSSDVNSTFLGYYHSFKLSENTSFNSNILAGYEQYKNKRVLIDGVNGTETARSDVNNFFISPAIELEHRIKILESLELKPNTSVNYTSSFFSSTDETGTGAANIKFDDRNVQILNTRLGLTTTLTLFENYKFYAGFGVDSREINEDMVKASISSTSFSFATNNQRSVNGNYFNFGFNVVDIADLVLDLNVEMRSADGDEEQKTANLSLGYRF